MDTPNTGNGPLDDLRPCANSKVKTMVDAKHDAIPEWLKWPQNQPPPESKLLAIARKEMYQALTLFHGHVKYVIYVLVSMIAAPLLIMRVWPASAASSEFHIVVGVLLTALPPLIGSKSNSIIQRYYEVYVSALVFAARAHIGANLHLAHPWIERTIQQAEATSDEVTDAQAFLKYRAKSKDDTFYHYRSIIQVVSYASLLAGVMVLLRGVTTAFDVRL